MQGARTRRRIIAVIYETLMPGTEYRNWTDALFLATAALAAGTMIVYAAWSAHPGSANIFIGSAAAFGLLAGYCYGAWRASDPGTFQAARLRVRSSNLLGGLCVWLLVALFERVTAH